MEVITYCLNTETITGGDRDVAPFSMEVKHMAKKSRYQDYMEGLKKLSEKKEKNASPKSILEKLKALKGQTAVVTVPVRNANE